MLTPSRRQLRRREAGWEGSPRRIRTVLCNVRTPRMNAIAERWIGGCRRELLDRTLVWSQAHLRRILRAYEIHHNQHRPHRSPDAAAPLKPLPEPVDLDRYHVRRQADQRVPPGRMTWTRFSARTPFWSRSKMNGKSASAATCPKDHGPPHQATRKLGGASNTRTAQGIVSNGPLATSTVKVIHTAV